MLQHMNPFSLLRPLSQVYNAILPSCRRHSAEGELYCPLFANELPQDIFGLLDLVFINRMRQTRIASQRNGSAERRQNRSRLLDSLPRNVWIRITGAEETGSAGK